MFRGSGIYSSIHPASLTQFWVTFSFVEGGACLGMLQALQGNGDPLEYWCSFALHTCSCSRQPGLLACVRAPSPFLPARQGAQAALQILAQAEEILLERKRLSIKLGNASSCTRSRAVKTEADEGDGMTVRPARMEPFWIRQFQTGKKIILWKYKPQMINREEWEKPILKSTDSMLQTYVFTDADRHQ